jgi:hypothetical protein
MNIAVAIPSHPVFAPLVERAKEVCAARGFRLLHGTEQECAAWLARHSAELALVTPLGYGAESFKTDYRIVVGPALALEGLTYTGSMYLAAGAEDLSECASQNPDDFLILMGAAVLAEKFDIATRFVATGAGANVRIEYGFDAAEQVTLDISDEWTDHVQQPLPLAFWVCRPDDVPADVAELVAAMARADLPAEELIVEQAQSGITAEREGRILWHWSNEIERAVQRTIELLYYWQFTTAIAATRVWQRDSSHPLQS